MDTIEMHAPPSAARRPHELHARCASPRPIESLDGYRRLWNEEQRLRFAHHLVWPSQPYREEHSILVAGCRPWQAAEQALRWPAARVISIHPDAASVAATDELKQKHDLVNLELRELPVERAAELDTSVDFIVCSGVLTGLADPDVGLSALRALLEPGGAMKLVVDAPYGRSGIHLLQEFCRRLGIRGSAQELADLAAALRTLPPSHPLAAHLRADTELGREEALADLFRPSRERFYSVPQLFDLIERNALSFGRWCRQAPYSPHCGLMSKLPQQAQMLRLPMKEHYAAVELFRGTMIQHSAIVYRSEDAAEAEQIHFEGDEWLGYVPIRAPGTSCVEQRLSPGLVAVIVNHSHVEEDLFAPINALEKRVFDEIDGSSSAGDVLHRALPFVASKRDVARGLFETLWWHDQLVFDASRVSKSSRVDAVTSLAR